MSNLYVICAILHGMREEPGGDRQPKKIAGAHIAGEPAADNAPTGASDDVQALLFQRQKVVLVRIVVFDFAGFNVVQPAVNVQFALAHLVADTRVCHEIFYLKNNTQ